MHRKAHKNFLPWANFLDTFTEGIPFSFISLIFCYGDTYCMAELLSYFLFKEYLTWKNEFYILMAWYAYKLIETWKFV